MIQFVLISDHCWTLCVNNSNLLLCIPLNRLLAGGEDFVQAQCWDFRDGDAPHWQALFHRGKGL